jgi:hypothetical protein
MRVWWRYAEGRDGLNQKGDWGETGARFSSKHNGSRSRMPSVETMMDADQSWMHIKA